MPPLATPGENDEPVSLAGATAAFLFEKGEIIG